MSVSLEEFVATHKATCHGRCPVCWLIREYESNLSEIHCTLDYSLNQSADKIPDSILWCANMRAFLLTRSLDG